MINEWMSWLALAGLVVILELFSGTFYLLMIALGLLAGALSAAFGVSLDVQMIAAAAVGAFATLLLHKSKYGWRRNLNVSRNPDVNMDIGQTILVKHWNDLGNGTYTARAMYRGAMWDIELQNAHAIPGTYLIEEIQGSRLLVRPS
jgi:membrane protein implicated in regulation of membrane protease activity